MTQIFSKLALGLAFLTLATAPARAFEEKTVKAAITELERASQVTMNTQVGIGGTTSSATVALLVILSNDKEAVPTFTALADKPGAPGLYGLIGLRIADPDGALYAKKAQEFLTREKGTKVQTIEGCIGGELPVEEIVRVPETSKNRRVLKHGEYAGRVFTSQMDWIQAGRVIDNGVLPQMVTIPRFTMAWVTPEQVKESPEVAKLKRESDELMDQDLLFKNPTGILKLMGIETDAKAMTYFTRDQQP